MGNLFGIAGCFNVVLGLSVQQIPLLCFIRTKQSVFLYVLHGTELLYSELCEPFLFLTLDLFFSFSFANLGRNLLR